MMPFMHKYISALFCCILLTACSQAAQQNGIDVDLEAIDHVSVLTLDGQEIQLQLPLFLGEIRKFGKNLQLVQKELPRSDTMYTLLVHRREESPLVVQVGRTMIQFGKNCYEGEGAEMFYRWIRKLTGESMFNPRLSNAELRAADLGRGRILEEEQQRELEGLLRGSVYLQQEEMNQYPIYPDYRLKLEYGERTAEVRMISTTTAAVHLGNDTIYYKVPQKLFAALTEWLPPQALTSLHLETLFQADKLELYNPNGSTPVNSWDFMQQPEKKAAFHQLIRQLRYGVPLAQKPQAIGSELFHFVLINSGKQQTVVIYADYFLIHDQVYRLAKIGQMAEELGFSKD